jgi:hypothetical protein
MRTQGIEVCEEQKNSSAITWQYVKIKDKDTVPYAVLLSVVGYPRIYIEVIGGRHIKAFDPKKDVWVWDKKRFIASCSESIVSENAGGILFIGMRTDRGELVLLSKIEWGDFPTYYKEVLSKATFKYEVVRVCLPGREEQFRSELGQVELPLVYTDKSPKFLEDLDTYVREVGDCGGSNTYREVRENRRQLAEIHLSNAYMKLCDKVSLYMQEYPDTEVSVVTQSSGALGGMSMKDRGEFALMQKSRVCLSLWLRVVPDRLKYYFMRLGHAREGVPEYLHLEGFYSQGNTLCSTASREYVAIRKWASKLYMALIGENPLRVLSLPETKQLCEFYGVPWKEFILSEHESNIVHAKRFADFETWFEDQFGGCFERRIVVSLEEGEYSLGRDTLFSVKGE